MSFQFRRIAIVAAVSAFMLYGVSARAGSVSPLAGQGQGLSSPASRAPASGAVVASSSVPTGPAIRSAEAAKSAASGAKVRSARIETEGLSAAREESDRYTAQLKKQTPGERLFELTRDDSVLDPINWSVMIHESRHQLVVYYKGRLFKIYPAVFGRSLRPGGKEWQGDRRTPEGVYEIIKKHRSRRYRWFLKLNYPNAVDRRRYQTLRADDEVPDLPDGQLAAAGNSIGIHGTDEPELNAGLVNWTTGCISVDNDAIDELYRLLPIGTVVIIQP